MSHICQDCQHFEIHYLPYERILICAPLGRCLHRTPKNRSAKAPICKDFALRQKNEKEPPQN